MRVVDTADLFLRPDGIPWRSLGSAARKVPQALALELFLQHFESRIDIVLAHENLQWSLRSWGLGWFGKCEAWRDW